MNLTHTISWNRVFADGITAPVGVYDVIIYAENEAGVRSQKSAQIIIPQPNATALPTFTPTPTATNTPTDTPVDRAFIVPSQTPMPTQTPFIFIAPINPATEDDDDDEGGVFSFFSAPKVLPITPQEQKSNILWGATAVAALGAFNATIAQRKRREAIAARVAERARKENKRRELQKIWDANGAAIYEANKAFESEHGHEMDSTTREKAIADATVGGVFNAGLYSTGLENAQKEKERIATMQALNEEILSEKEGLLELRDLPEDNDKTQTLADWKEGDMRATDAAVAAQTWLLPHGCSSENVRDCIEKLHQGQGDDTYANSCASFSEAMTLNLLYGLNYQGGAIAQENQASFYSLGGNLGIKFGIPPYLHVNMINDRLKQIAVDNPNLTRYEAVYTNNVFTNNNSPEDLINNLDEGKATIVFVSWDTSVPILMGEHTGVGHAMTFVGYDTTQDEFSFLDSGEIDGGPITTYSREKLEDKWLETSSFLIPTGSMITFEATPDLLSSQPKTIPAPAPSDIPSIEETPSPNTQEDGEMP